MVVYGFRLLIVLSVLLTPAIASAQPLPAPAATPPPLDASGRFNVGDSEWMATVGSAWGTVVFHSAGGYQYFTQTLSWGRVLSGPKFPGMIRGRFEWAFEVVPVYAQYHPDRAYGLGLSPICWRWNFEPRGKYAPYAELSGGLLWSTQPVPENTTTSNFTAHAGAGVRMLIGKQQAIVVMYRFDHISNGNRLERNPGVNAHAIHVGVSVLRPRQ